MVTLDGTTVVVVGAGVSGLTTALLLAEGGAHVRVVAKVPPESSFSVSAGAIWGPYMVNHSEWMTWSIETLHRLRQYSTDKHQTGVEMVSGIEAARTVVDPPGYAHLLPDFRMCSTDELPGECRSGWRYSAPVVDMPRYLAFLEGTLARTHRVRVELQEVTNLSDLATGSTIVVNCTGFGARELVPDSSMTAIRGELVVVKNPGIREFFLEKEEDPPDLTYFLPQGDTVILGGTAHRGREQLDADPGAAQAIIARCAKIDSRLQDAEIVNVRVGIRPCTPTVRVERDANGVIHNYGHGGSGLTLSWGCAGHVRDVIAGIA